MEWYQQSVEEVLKNQAGDATRGLTAEQVQERREKFGLNELMERGLKSPWKILWEQLTGLMTVILILSAVISALLGEYTDTIAILVIVVLNAVLGFTQEYRAERAMAALKKMAVPTVRVRRDGHLAEVKAQELVPGDLLILEAGNAIPADCRLVETVNLRVQEAVLTGESEPVEKQIGALKREQIALGDQLNMLFMGTVVTYGRGTAVVVETGMRTQLGHIADMIQTVRVEQTPLQKRLDNLGKTLTLAVLGIVVLVFGLGLLRGEPIKLMFQTSISIAVAAIPEGLMSVVTIALALGAQRMLKRNALIRKLPAVETLGSVTVICSDKTGTLTQNRMTVTVLDVAGNRMDISEKMRSFSPRVTESETLQPMVVDTPAAALLLVGGALCNDAVLEKVDREEGGLEAIGDPTEGALVIAAARAGLMKSDLEAALPRVAELPFDSDRKRMTTVHHMQPEQLPVALRKIWEQYPLEKDFEFIAVTKGSVDGLLNICTRVWADGKAKPLDESWIERVQVANNQLAENGMRVLGVAFQGRDSEKQSPEHPYEQDLILIGMVGMIDPARPEVKDAVTVAQRAGIQLIMITGDHPLTALYIARELGITQQRAVVTGVELVKMSKAELNARVLDTPVYARVSPVHKLDIIEALKDHGHIVAMTGDGVNDAPALKRADIGVAMGITGTDVSKEASDMVLLDDNFATIVSAVEEGRRIYANIRKFIRYTLTSNWGEILVMLVGPFLGMPLPLTPLQILFVNLVTDGLPGLALTVEPAEPTAMRRKPQDPKANMLDKRMAIDVLWIGSLIGLFSLLA
ncbi:MAG: HAD-IC family P-type ATPase, partial [Anaerolineaceae bacterium]|nr:HAD-IC family P-type ATPase [Anaerolineaceae bacterium]